MFRPSHRRPVVGPGHAVLVCAVLLAGCSGAGNASDFAVRGTNVVVNSTVPFTRHSDFPSRVESTIDAALKYWGGTWDDLRGKSLVFEADQHVACEGSQNAIGCYDGDIRVSTRDFGTPFNCVEETVLVHEIGHAIIGDPDHTDPRWMDFSSVMRDLEGRPGYGDTGDAPCQISINVWRHPPATTN